MRILLLSTYFRPDVASTGVIMSTLADEFVARGHEVTVLTSVPHYGVDRIWNEFSGGLCFTEQVRGMRIHRLYTHVARNRANLFSRALSYGSFSVLSIARGLFVPRHDVILAPSPPLSNGVIADLLGRFRGTPFVYNVQDIWPDVAVRAGLLKNEKTIRRLKKMENYVYRHAAGITVISDGFRKNLLAKGVPEAKISIIPNFIDSEFITPQHKDNAFSKKHDIADKFVVLFAGNMGFSQGLETVLDAAKLLEGVPQIRFLMVGNGARRSAAEDYLKKLCIANVTFLPFQPHEQLPQMYGSADVCVIPLRSGFTNESVPCKLFTIMAAGKPAIAAVDPGSDTSELLERARCGVRVDPENPRSLADAILHYFQNPQEILEAGRNARLCTENDFHSGRLAEAYLDAMQKAIDTRREHLATALPAIENRPHNSGQNVRKS
jgi:colanic acid biosynthesis glycosyl transferase WcaI